MHNVRMSTPISEFIPSTPYALATVSVFSTCLTISVLYMRRKSTVFILHSCPTLCDLWIVTHQAPLSMGFSRQEYWSGLLFPSPGDLLNPGIETGSPELQADSLPIEL